MNKSIIFWGPQESGKTHNADICTLLFNEKKVIEITATDLNKTIADYNISVRLMTELVVVDECFEEEQIHELEPKIRRTFISPSIRIIYLFQSETIPVYMDITKYHVIKCNYQNRQPLHLSESFEKVMPENIHLLQSEDWREVN